MVKFYHYGNPNKKTLLFLHGWGSPHEIFHEYISMFQDKYHIIVPSAHGYNEEKDVRSIGVDGNAKEINAYLKSKGLRLHMIIGISFGANVALKLAALNEIPISVIIADAPNISAEADVDMAKAMADMAGSYQANAETLKPQFIETYTTVWGEQNAKLQCDKLFSLSSELLRDDAYSYFSSTMHPAEVGKTDTLIFQCYGTKELDKIRNAEFICQLFANCHTHLFADADHCACFMGNAKQYVDTINALLKEYPYSL